MKKLTYSNWIIFLALFLAPFYLTEFRLSLLGKFLTFAIIAIGISLIWGYTGILSLGHGVYFGIGGYCMAMYLKMEAATGSLPDFMSWSGIASLPWFWKPFDSFGFALGAAVLLPAFLAAVIGYLTFKNRIKGVYFSLISQAIVVIFVTLCIGNQQWTGGTNGLTNFQTVLGISLTDPVTQIILYFITAAVLLMIFLLSRYIIQTKAGKLLIAVRDSENRARFLGYNTTIYQVLVYILSAAFAGIAGVLFVLQVGLISPEMMGIIPSIEMVLWVAIGGRTSLIGAIIGAIVTNSAKTFFSENYPDYWLFLLGFMFISIVLFMPNGLVGLYHSVRQRLRRPKEVEEIKNEADTVMQRS
ncbi:urea ABC transporter permease subunit UrtC [Bacillus sp. V5-8f]|uniref:urea ABC transporter permease subunit UrtC n=1 Tax=Bacillus sp. V5-8f TaxID=2053044 RepID=UPI000C76C69A|nr:urea ABC transporter permease subunit UrtC [Bacillus sp. V5-8f]PLT33075.1 urea ABC transporter permease subunit UrtC [Bacillus sp. V5-8f]